MLPVIGLGDRNNRGDNDPGWLDEGGHIVRIAIGITLIIFVVTVLLVLLMKAVAARDDGRYANSPLKPWFDQLASKKGLCCSFADGAKVDDVDWDVRSGQYWVHVWGEWVPVPESAVITEPNRFGPSVVWPFKASDESIEIRCFMPGAGG